MPHKCSTDTCNSANFLATWRNESIELAIGRKLGTSHGRYRQLYVSPATEHLSRRHPVAKLPTMAFTAFIGMTSPASVHFPATDS